jgi:hypothetical protein
MAVTPFMRLGSSPNRMDHFLPTPGTKCSLYIDQGENHGNCKKAGRKKGRSRKESRCYQGGTR